jgi:hypothetical protein
VIENTINIPFKQDILYGGFIYCLANFLNNDYILNEKNKYKNINLTYYFKNKLFHRYTDQFTNPLLFIEPKILLKDVYPFSIKGERLKLQFHFNFSSNELKDLYKIYFVDVNLTRMRKHCILVLKSMTDPLNIIVVDPRKDYIMQMANDDLFKSYYVMGFSSIEHKYNDDVYYNYDDVSHLIK